jgi:hypothetical protein
MIGVASNPKYINSGFPPFFLVMVNSDPIASSMPMDFVTAMIEDSMIPDATDKTSSVKTNANGVDVGVTTGFLNLQLSPTKKMAGVCELLSFQSNKKLVVITFFASRNLKDTLLPLADKFIDTIKLLNPDGTDQGGA